MPTVQQGAIYNARSRTDPIPTQRTTRSLEMRALTSFPAGKCTPVAAFNLLREDRLRMSRIRLNFEMMETAELLANAVNVRVMAVLIPHLAFDRFDGIDALNRSYAKELAAGASQIIPYFTTLTEGAHGANAIHKAMGLHARPGQLVNGAYVEAYNTWWNFRARNRSPDLTQRVLTDLTLAPAFWNHTQFAHIVPDFDQALIDGEVPLTMVNPQIPVRGLGLSGTVQTSLTNLNARQFDGNVTPMPFGQHVLGYGGTLIAGTSYLTVKTKAGTGSIPDVFAELQEGGVTISLSNIEVARKTQAFAALRKQYGGIEAKDDHLIDLMMNGLTVPEQAWRQPILLADKSTIFGMAKRYSTTSDDLTASVVNGATFVDLAITTPQVPMGGVVMICVEVTPEQLFERQQDPFLHTVDQSILPEFLRDTLDPEKVEIVQNQRIDNDHATPTGTFGYEPLHARWAHSSPKIGGKFFRPLVDAPTDEDRQRIWACETANPTLARDFYLCTNIHQKPFVVTNQDPFECVLRGSASIDGLTVFGGLLIEASDDYEKVLGEVDTGRIPNPGVDTGEADESESSSEA